MADDLTFSKHNRANIASMRGVCERKMKSMKFRKKNAEK